MVNLNNLHIIKFIYICIAFSCIDKSNYDTFCREKDLAKKYYDKLFKEYCIADLSRYKENKVCSFLAQITVSVIDLQNIYNIFNFLPCSLDLDGVLKMK